MLHASCLMKNITLQEKYTKNIIPTMREKFGYKNAMYVPRILKVVGNSAVGRFKEKTEQEEIVKYLGLITGQKPMPRPARQSIASFKVREGQTVGYKITLRGARMYDFLSRLIDAALPRMRDFRGLSLSGIDEGGSLTIGLKENIVFPETIGEDMRTPFGLQITVVTNARSKKETEALLRQVGFPLERKE